MAVMIYQFIWTRGNEFTLEQSVPLVWHGEHIRRMGWSNEIVLVLLEGFRCLSDDYRKHLEGLGYHLLDCQAMAKDIVDSQYPELKTYPAIWKYWFIRWNVLRRITEFGGDRGQVIHLDGDVVLMCDPLDLERDVAGKTFMLQGCPAFTAIGRADWFDVWEKELSAFLQNRSDYIALAMVEKANPAFPGRQFCNVCAYNPTWFQDQDLLEFLIASGRLPQARTGEVFDSRFFWIQNPLFPGEWFDEQVHDGAKRVFEKENRAFVAHKQVAYYHFQSDFTRYCQQWMRWYRRGCEQKLIPAMIVAETKHGTWLGTAIERLKHRLKPHDGESRRTVYETVFRSNPRTGNLLITDIVNSRWN